MEKQNMYPRTRHAIRFTAGSKTLEEDSLVLEKLAKNDTESLRRQFGLMQDKKFRIQPEFSYSTERILSLGFRLGCQDIYGGHVQYTAPFYGGGGGPGGWGCAIAVIPYELRRFYGDDTAAKTY